jgi:hypothetical protein
MTRTLPASLARTTGRLTFKVATEQAEFAAIHRLNYETFVEEIPQHPANAQRMLVDRFHPQNLYVICLADTRLVGMACGRCERPFSLDYKVPNLDRHLPAHGKAVEIRLLSIAHAYRKTAVFAGLIAFLSRHFKGRGCDLVVISATVREARLYRHIGFEAFGERVGPTAASYQPMYLTLVALNSLSTSLHRRASSS